MNALSSATSPIESSTAKTREWETNFLKFAAFLRCRGYSVARIYQRPRLSRPDEHETRVVFELPPDLNIRQLEADFRNKKTQVEPMQYADEFFYLRKWRDNE